MTQADLNKARNLQDQMRDVRSKIAALKVAAENIVPILDGMPHAKSQSSRVEHIAAMINDYDRDLDNLQDQFDIACVDILRELRKTAADGTINVLEHNILVYRYVACMSFAAIEEAVNLSEARVYFWHRQGVQKLLDNKNDS